MPVIVNNPPAATSESSNGLGFLLGAIALLILFLLVVSYGSQIASNLRIGGTQVTVPDKINVNVNKSP